MSNQIVRHNSNNQIEVSQDYVDGELIEDNAITPYKSYTIGLPNGARVPHDYEYPDTVNYEPEKCSSVDQQILSIATVLGWLFVLFLIVNIFFWIMSNAL